MASQPQVGGAYARYVLSVLVVVYVFNFIDRQILSILAEEIKAHLGVSDAEIGFLYGTAFAVFYAVFGIPLGKLADVWSRRRLISIGLAFWSTMTALSGTARGFSSLAVFRFGVGIGEASASPAAFSMLSDYFAPKVRATILAIYSSGVYIGAGIGLVLGGAIVDAWRALYPDPALAPLGLHPWQAAFFAVGLPGILVAVWVWTLREPPRGLSEGLSTPPEPHPWRQFGQALVAVLPPLTLWNLGRLGGGRALAGNLLCALVIGLIAWGAIALLANPIQWTALGIGVYCAASWVQALAHQDPAAFRLMFRSRAFVLATLGYPCLSFVTYGLGFWSPPYLLRAHDVPLAQAGLALGAGAALGGWLGVTLGGWLSDRLKPRIHSARLWVGVASATLSTPFVLLFVMTESVWVAYFASFCFSLLSPMWVGAGAGTVNDLVIPRMRATASAYYILMITFIGLALGPFTIGQISDFYIAAGSSDGEALQAAMLWSLISFAVGAGILCLATRYLFGDEQSRNKQALALGQSGATSGIY